MSRSPNTRVGISCAHALLSPQSKWCVRYPASRRHRRTVRFAHLNISLLSMLATDMYIPAGKSSLVESVSGVSERG